VDTEETVVDTEETVVDTEETVVDTEETVVDTEETVVDTEDSASTAELDLDNEVAEMFRAIWEDMHYDDPDELSRTLFQVDQSLDYIEKILGQFHDIMETNDLIITQD
jgi:hypothetical protein